MAVRNMSQVRVDVWALGFRPDSGDSRPKARAGEDAGAEGS
jgi:hypothetical protein